MLKRNLLLLSLTALATLTAKAQTSWPTKPIRLIVPSLGGKKRLSSKKSL
jgi:tripartite-type tricarboxylate transporter receptor subunit TctC